MNDKELNSTYIHNEDLLIQWITAIKNIILIIILYPIFKKAAPNSQVQGGNETKLMTTPNVVQHTILP